MSASVVTADNVATCRVMREVRLEMRRQGKSSGGLSELLGVSQRTAQRKLIGETVVFVHELIQIGMWLNIESGLFFERAGV